jgi:hypothetical protein
MRSKLGGLEPKEAYFVGSVSGWFGGLLSGNLVDFRVLAPELLK